ncbi:MAG: hypothetical protein M1343_03030 [Chloroflexi bacterium]|nr:hypothetical protein [Chloroflexota bacterium]MDA8187145.1 hypothetical protein [Dehalococcoidales bacterium]
MVAVFEPQAPRQSSASLDAGQGTRDDEWLRYELDYIWDAYFRDVMRVNVVKIQFSREWKARLGMITLSASGHTTHIGINSLLRNRQAPWFVPMITIAHELVHYAHGFGSPLPREHAHPHRGGIVARELERRGLGEEHRMWLKWVCEDWHSFYARAKSGLRLVHR